MGVINPLRGCPMPSPLKYFIGQTNIKNRVI